jgi:4-amino-4-deoxy-L-arabinose transferase-like glycosyltransferase
MALFPSQVFFTNVLASEILFTPLFLGSMLLFVKGNRSRRWWLAVLLGGIVLGLATLTRTITTLFLLPVVLYWLHETRSWKNALPRLGLGVIGLAIVITPWIVRNYYAVGRACLSTNTGINLYVGNQPSSGMGYNHHAALDFDLWDPTKEAEIDSVASARAWEYIRRRPFAFLGRGVMKVMFFYAVNVDPLDHQLLHPDGGGHSGIYLALATLVETYYLAVLLMAALAVPVVLRSRIHRGAPTTLLLLTLIYWTGVHFVFFGVGRFHFPVVPILAALVAVFLAYRIDLSSPQTTDSQAE